jgi:hypothetical protein
MYRSATALLTDSVRTFVVELNQSCLPVGVRDRRCSATTTLYPHCSETDIVPHLCRCRTRGPAHLHEHLEDMHTLSGTIVKGSRAGLPPGQRMILKAAQSTTRMSNGRWNLLRISGCKATPFGKLGVQLRTPGENGTGNPSTRSRQAAQQ